jgi:putative ABC transport system permease protein
MRSLRALLIRLMNLLRKQRLERELAAELKSHLDLHIADNIGTGMEAGEARRQALIALGGLEQTRLSCRDRHRLGVVEELGQDLRFAGRLLTRERAFTFGVVSVLAFGICVNNTFFSMLNSMVLRGLPLERIERIVDISARDADGRQRRMSYLDFEDLKSGSSSFTALAAYSSSPMAVGDERRPPERFLGAYVSAGLLTLLGEVPLAGRDFQQDDDRFGAPPVVILGESVWEQRYRSDRSLIGKTVRVNGTVASVIGVMPDRSRFPTNAEVWLPLSQLPGLSTQNRDARSLTVMGWLAGGRTTAGADTEVRAIAQRLATQHPETNRGIRIDAVPVNDRHTGSATHPAWLAFITAGALVLLIACANVANLLLMRSVHRAREIAIRRALGATRTRIIRQLLSESLLIASIGGVIGLALSAAAARLLTIFIPRDVLPYWMLPTMDGQVLITLAAVCTGTTIVFGLVPALHASRSDVNDSLRACGRSAGQGVRARHITASFLVTQFVLAMVLLAHVALTVRQAQSVYRRDPPIDMTRLLSASISLSSSRYEAPDSRLNFYRSLDDQLQRVPGIKSAAFTTSLPLSGAVARRFEVEGVQPHAGTTSAMVVRIGPRYFSTLDLPLVQGREFSDRDGVEGAHAAVVNQQFAERFLSNRNPIGIRIRMKAPGSAPPAPWLTIVGISPNVRQRAFPEPEPVLYLPYRSDPVAAFSLIVRGSTGADPMASALRTAVLELDADLPLYQVTTLDRAVAEADWNRRLSTLLIAMISSIAIALAAVGLYAVTAHAISQRTREVGIRMALGASPARLAWLLLRRAFLYLAIGLLLGVGAVVVWSRAFESGPTRLTDIQGLAMAAGLLLLLGVAACFPPAIRAMRMNPVPVLRYE